MSINFHMIQHFKFVVSRKLPKIGFFNILEREWPLRYKENLKNIYLFVFLKIFIHSESINYPGTFILLARNYQFTITPDTIEGLGTPRVPGLLNVV